MAWIFFLESEASDSRSSPGSVPSPIASATDTLKASYCPECDQVSLIPLRSGTTCARCEQSTCRESKSSSEDSLAKTSALRVAEEAWAASEADYFSRSCAWPKKSSPASYSSKTSLLSGPGDLTALGSSWPISAMICDGVLYPLKKLEHPISAKDGGAWVPCDCCEDYLCTIHQLHVYDYECPPLEEWTGNPYFPSERKSWPTPRATDWKDCGPFGSKSHKHRLDRKYLDATVKSPDKPNGKLNPEWTEWLMGFPLAWTELDASVTPWFRSKRAKLSKSCQESNKQTEEENQ